MAESIALAQELVREINRKVRGGNIVIKLNMEKAMIVLINGKAAGFFKSSKGIHQGDPLSPSLFILAAEVLSRGLLNFLDKSSCTPFKLRRGCPRVSYLLYPDDTLLFLNGSQNSLKNILEFLKSYKCALGQKINTRKSALFCSAKLPSHRVRLIERLLGINKATSSIMHLRVPLAFGRVKQWLAGKMPISGRVACLSPACPWGTPVHSIAASHLPAQVTAMLEKPFANFLWGWFKGKKKLHLKGWKTIGLPKAEGGLGIRRLFKFMYALKMKLGWAVKFKEEASLWSKFMSAKRIWPFTPSGEFFVRLAWELSRLRSPLRAWSRWVWHAKLPPRISMFTWKILMKVVPVDEVVQSRGVHLASRNSVRFDEKSISVVSVIAKIRRWLFLIATQPPSKLAKQLNVEIAVELRIFAAPSFVRPPRFVKWKKPDPGWAKLNVDGSARGKPGLSRGGGVCRDDKGDFVFGLAVGYGVGSNTYAELWVVHNVLAICFNFGLSRVVVELTLN
ncbi:uncharacterized protein LOC131238995 [Magnolia sinica]|uniref:uncharacterized protein LOC131238995 n=1 Tax=Magnolia sinica TaxID=86752 RepID=UPI002659811A|nr:uncharacterized protein LOC131238995 [Magnolia sinica]